MAGEFELFLSYTTADRSIARGLYASLKKDGFIAWLDCECIKGGQNWDFEIQRALDRASIVIILWSENSRDKRGYIQREVKISIDKLKEKLVDDIYLIPVLIGDAPAIPDQFKSIQCLTYSDANFLDSLTDAVNHQIERLGGQRTQIQQAKDLYWRSNTLKEEWDGLPGYEVNIEVLDITSDRFKGVDQISLYIRGYFMEAVFAARSNKLGQNPELYNYAQEKWSRTDTYSAECGDPSFCGRILSIKYLVSTYGAGAAHPVHGYKTFVFLLEPLLSINSLRDIFSSPDASFPILQDLVRNRLAIYNLGGEEEDTEHDIMELDQEWINRGTENWNDLSAFLFNEESIDILFSSYQVAPYAAGTPQISVNYSDIIKLMKREYITALGIERFLWASRT